MSTGCYKYMTMIIVCKGFKWNMQSNNNHGKAVSSFLSADMKSWSLVKTFKYCKTICFSNQEMKKL